MGLSTPGVADRAGLWSSTIVLDPVNFSYPDSAAGYVLCLLHVFPVPCCPLKSRLAGNLNLGRDCLELEPGAGVTSTFWVSYAHPFSSFSFPEASVALLYLLNILTVDTSSPIRTFLTVSLALVWPQTSVHLAYQGQQWPCTLSTPETLTQPRLAR